MSLINQMLQDLEKRRASSAERGALPDQVRALPPARNSRAWWVWWALGVGIAAILTPSVMDWYQRNWQPRAAVPQPPAVEPQPPAPAPPVQPASDGGAIKPPDPAPIASRLALELERVPAAGVDHRATAAPAGAVGGPRDRDNDTQAPTAAQAPRHPGIPSKRIGTPVAEPPPPVVRVPTAPVAAADETTSKKLTPMGKAPSAYAAGASAPSAAVATNLTLVPPAAPLPATGGKVVAPMAETDRRAGTHPVAMSGGSSAPAPVPDAKFAALPPAGAKTEPLSSVSRAKVETHVPPQGARNDTLSSRADTSQPHIDKRLQQVTPEQLAENDYRKAIALLNQGRLADAQDALRLALLQNPAHSSARQALFSVLLDAKKHAQAEQVLQDGLRLDPGRSGFAMALARLQVERGDTGAAVETLQKTAPAAHDSPDYLAFLAALLQRQARHQAAIDHYEAALRLAPQSGVWLMGLGISLQAVNRNPEAHSAFRRAKATNTLNPELQAFVDQRIRQVQ